MHEDHRRGLIEILQLAYSGERAAGYAYRGHWRSCSEPEERTLASLGAGPSRYREARAMSSGTTSATFLLGLWPAPPPRETIRSG